MSIYIHIYIFLDENELTATSLDGFAGNKIHVKNIGPFMDWRELIEMAPA